MTQQEKLERNKQIALMLGWKYYEPKVDIDHSECGGLYRRCEVWSKIPIELDRFDEDDQYYPKTNWFKKAYEHGGYKTNLNYDSDWESLMEVVEFIETLNFENTIMEFFWLNGKNVSLYQKNKQNGNVLWETHGRFKNVQTKKDAVFLIVSDFAQKYNNYEKL